MSHNEAYSHVNVPFSWELKPGVSKAIHDEASIDIRHVTVNLPPPPRLSKSARFSVHDLHGVLPPSQIQPQLRSSTKKGNVNKQEDPFVAAYRKCTEYSINGKLDTDDKNDACRARTKNMFTLSCKYSCTVSSNNMGKVQSQGTVPFSWENKPGVRKLTSQEGPEEDYFLKKLPPPPCPSASARISIHDIKTPPSRRGPNKYDDPFLAAYKECTKSTSKSELAKKDVGSGLKKGMFSFSCKRSCSVRNDNLVRISQLYPERDRSGVEM
ncbi:hypothetical protein PTKIN_Ptkin09bG0151400 [Pterospermum kingtungense]